MRNIRAREEICYDYSMSYGSPYDEFLCSCQSSLCRGVVTGSDWMILDLQERYQGYFSPYLQRRIAQAREEMQSLSASSAGADFLTPVVFSVGKVLGME